MGSRNVNVLGCVVEAVNARTVPRELLAPGFCMEHRASAVTDRTYRGANGWREWMDDLFEVFATGARLEIQEILAEDDDIVVAVFRLIGRGARSQETLQLGWAGVTWFRLGQVTRTVSYATRSQALQAMGPAVARA
jgi:ketosteroid isomerase-like protein